MKGFGINRYQFISASLVACLMMFGSLAFAKGERSPDEVSRITRDVSERVFSPYCPGKTLAMCPSGNAAKARRDVQDMARDGLSSDEIIDAMVARYGEEYRLHEPPAQDNYKLLILLTLGFLLCVTAVIVFTRRRTTAANQVADGEEELAESFEDNEELEIYLAELRDEYLD